MPKDPEDVAGSDVWARLTEDEQKERKLQYTKAKLAVANATALQRKQDEKDFHPM